MLTPAGAERAAAGDRAVTRASVSGWARLYDPALVTSTRFVMSCWGMPADARLRHGAYGLFDLAFSGRSGVGLVVAVGGDAAPKEAYEIRALGGADPSVRVLAALVVELFA